jgi:hypothetical protein
MRRHPLSSRIAIAMILWFILGPTFHAFALCADPTGVSVNGTNCKKDKAIRVTGRDITIKVYFERVATDYRVSEDSSFARCEWKSFGGEKAAIEVKHTLKEGNGTHTVYFQAKRDDTLGTVYPIQIEM